MAQTGNFGEIPESEGEDPAREKNPYELLARQQAVLRALRDEIGRLSAPPNSYARILGVSQDESVNILDQNGRIIIVVPNPAISPSEMEPGRGVILSANMEILRLAEQELVTSGPVVRVKSFIDDTRVIVTTHTDEEIVAIRAPALVGVAIKAGDVALFDSGTKFILRLLPKTEMDEVMLEETPNVSYGDIGGLESQIEAVRDAIELPYLYPDAFREFSLHAPKGVLLYGPPGCGKTMIAKAIARSLAEAVEQRTGQKLKGYFLSVRGPELLTKWVGDTEGKIREIFERARERASGECPVIIFFDEMDALFRNRGTGISSDVEDTIVAQLLTMIDGLVEFNNVVVIGASNRQDLIDPAVLRPGRLEIKIRVDRPGRNAARDILSKYIVSDLPFDVEGLERFGGDVKALAAWLIEHTAAEIYREDGDTAFVEVVFARGAPAKLHFRHFASGAMFKAIVDRAKKKAVKRWLAGGAKGLRASDFLDSVWEEYKENEDIYSANPADWQRLYGKNGEQVVNVKRLLGSAAPASRAVQEIRPGQYL